MMPSAGRWLSLGARPSADTLRRPAAAPTAFSDIASCPYPKTGTPPAHRQPEALDTGQRTDFETPAHRSAPASAPVLTGQRTASGSATNVELAQATGGGNCPASLSGAHGQGSHGLPPADARLLGCLEAAPGRPTNGQAGKYLEAVREARQAGATDPMIACGVLEKAGGTPWAGPNAARDKARGLIADFEAACGFDGKPKTVPTILVFVRGCAAAEKRAAAGESLENPCGVASVRQWAARNRKALTDAETWPALPGHSEGAAPGFQNTLDKPTTVR